MTNLYDELIDDLNRYNKTIEDIKFIETNTSRWRDEGEIIEVDINNFIEVAKETNYYDGYGCVEISLDLKIVGEDWWLEREEYDGSEWFEFKTIPKRPTTKKHIDSLIED